MRSARRNLILVSVGAFLSAVAASGQDSPSLGDVARQTRLQRTQKDAPSAGAAKDGRTQDAQSAGGSTPVPATAAPGTKNQGADAKANSPAKDVQASKPAKRVITNDEIPEHIGPTATRPASTQTPDDEDPDPQPDAPEAKGSAATGSAEQWKAQIQSMKTNIAALQQNINEFSASIQYAGANCVANCVQWNERQKQKQDQVEAMKGQLESAQKSLETLQDAARKQGFGSSVYDP